MGNTFDHISVYCGYLDHPGKQFAAGKNKASVLIELKDYTFPRTSRRLWRRLRL